jgi:hypothetical protein
MIKERVNIAPNEVSKQIEQDMKLIRCGISGEKNVAYELKNSHMPILILHDLNLEYKELKEIRGFGDVKCEKY